MQRTDAQWIGMLNINKQTNKEWSVDESFSVSEQLAVDGLCDWDSAVLPGPLIALEAGTPPIWPFIKDNWSKREAVEKKNTARRNIGCFSIELDDKPGNICSLLDKRSLCLQTWNKLTCWYHSTESLHHSPNRSNVRENHRRLDFVCLCDLDVKWRDTGASRFK